MCVFEHVCVCVWVEKDAAAVSARYAYIFASIRWCICIAHTLRLSDRETEVSNPRGITCHGECLSGGELEPVLGESAGISPLAAQSSTAQQHKPGQAQKVGQPETHACTYAQTHKHTRTAKIDAALVSRCGCI